MMHAGDDGKGKGRKRDSRLSIIAILLGYPAVASAEEESERDQMVVSRHRKIDVKLLYKTRMHRSTMPLSSTHRR